MVREKTTGLKIWKRTGEEHDKVKYKTAKGKAKRVVARVKAEAIEGLYYDQLETVEGQQGIYRIAAGRDQSGKDIYARYAMSKVPQEIFALTAAACITCAVLEC